jgi:anti-anti-sigma factor
LTNLSDIFRDAESELPAFIEKVDDFPHLKIIRLKGRIDRTALPEMKKLMTRVKKNPGSLHKSILLDLKNVSHLDTVGIAELIKVLSELRQKKRELGLVNVPDKFKSLLEILKVHDLFHVFSSQKQAFEKIMAWSEEWE